MTAPGGPSGQQTDLHRIFYQCRLGKDDLERLFSIAREGITIPEVRFSTVAGNTRFWKEDLQDLISTVNDNAPEINGKWANLALEANSQERGAKISVDLERVEVNIFGSDSTWSHGQMARIERFLISRWAVFNSPRYENTVTYLSVAFFLRLGAFFLIHGIESDTVEDCLRQARNANRDAYISNFLIFFTFAFGIIFPFYQFMKRRALRAKFSVSENLASGSWWSRMSTSERIAAIGIPIAALATFAALVTAANDLWGK
ncbi:hypothetical protein [Streptomyces albogriseolus]|uniref:hypothetical protein n=1 Tax=Streptomyces albogriseolus TaxID=1887 RepID=UPI00380F10D3